MVSIPSPGQYTCILETPEGLLLRATVLRIDETEALIDTPFRIPDQDGFEVIFERPDGHAEVLHTQVKQGIGGLILRWDHRHPSEMTALERLLAPASPHPLGSRDVALDIEAALVQRTRMVSTSKIAAQRDSVRVLKLDVVKELIAASVDEALERSGALVNDAERTKILEESEQQFQEMLAQMKAEKDGIEAQRSRLQRQFERAQVQLERERAREIGADRFTLSEDGIDEIERRMGAYLDRAIVRGKTDPALEGELRGVIEGLLDSEREKISDLARAASNDTIEVLEQKISRLARSLTDTQKERDHARDRAHALESGAGPYPIHNIHLPGIDTEDPNKGRKLALLADLIRENHDLRTQMEEAGSGTRRIGKITTADGPATPEAS